MLDAAISEMYSLRARTVSAVPLSRFPRKRRTDGNQNYSGDIMNFGLSADLAEMDDIEVAQVIVKDDVAVPDREEGTGRRGIAGTVLCT